MINFDVTKYDMDLIFKIATEAVAFAAKHGIKYNKQTAIIDLTACHANGTPLDLERLLDAANKHPFDFGHDILGINKHINEETGQLQDCFVPRFAHH